MPVIFHRLIIKMKRVLHRHELGKNGISHRVFFFNHAGKKSSDFYRAIINEFFRSPFYDNISGTGLWKIWEVNLLFMIAKSHMTFIAQ